MKTIMHNIVTAIINASNDLNETPKYKGHIWSTNQSAVFTANDGSASALIHIHFQPMHNTNEEDQDAFNNYQPDLDRILKETIATEFAYHIHKQYANQPKRYISMDDTDDFNTLIRGWAFPDQTALWASITGTDECLIITLRHYPQ